MVREGDIVIEADIGVMPLLTGTHGPRKVVISQAGKARKHSLLQPSAGPQSC